MLWDQGEAASLPTALPAAHDERAADPAVDRRRDAPNGARYLALADGDWRDEALRFERAFLLFDERRRREARGWRGSSSTGATASSAATGSRKTGNWVRRPERLRRHLALCAPAARGARQSQHPSQYWSCSAMAVDPHLFDHQARRHPPQPDRRGHQDARGGRPARRRLEAHPDDQASRPRASTASTRERPFFNDLVAS